MVVPAVLFSQVVLAVHILAVVAGFGVTFAYPFIGAIGDRLDKRAMPWYHRVQHEVGQKVITPGLVLILITGIYLASDLHEWKMFFVQWGLGAAIVLGGLGGAFFAPRERRLAEVAERDIAAAADGEVTWSPEYESIRKQVAAVGLVSDVIIVLTIYFMTVLA